jgi:hypothetical protein
MLSPHVNPYFLLLFFKKLIKTWVKNWVATVLLPKLLISQIRVDQVPLVYVLNALRPPLDALKDPQVQPWSQLAQPIHSMLLSMPSLWTL